MANKRIDWIRMGQTIAAAPIEALRRRVQAQKLSVGPNMTAQTGPAGTAILMGNGECPDGYWAKVESAGYSVREQIPADAGTWVDGTRTTSALEVNGNSSVPLGTIVYVYAVNGFARFQYDAC